MNRYVVVIIKLDNFFGDHEIWNYDVAEISVVNS